MRAHLTTALAIAMTVGLAACSSGGSTAPTTTLPGTVPTTTASSSTTTLPAPSTAPTTETPTSTVAPTTEPTPTTEPVPATLPDNLTEAEFAQLRTEVIAEVEEANRLFDEVRRNPTDPEIAAQYRAITTPEQYEYVFGEFVIKYVQNNLEERTNPDLPATEEYLLETFVIDPVAGTASVTYCYLSSNLLYQVGGAADGSDELQDDRFAAVLVRSDLVFQDGRWLDDGGRNLSIAEGETTCAPA